MVLNKRQERFAEEFVKTGNEVQSLHVENNESLIISTAERDTEFYKVLQNNEAFNRLQQLSDK